MEKKKLPYTYEFAVHELEEIAACNREHGFAVVKNVLTQDLVNELKKSVIQQLEPTGDSKPGSTFVDMTFIEKSKPLASLMEYEPYMRIAQALYGPQPMTLNRSAAIYKSPGAPSMAWHTDWVPKKKPYHSASILNTTGASSNWFYLNGTHPDRGGLAIIPDSHTDDWSGPEGFQFTTDKHSFYREGTAANPYDKLDFPEVLPLFTDPGDLIIFAERTYHAVFPHNGSEVRLSCGLSFRPGQGPIPDCWPTTETAQTFIQSRPKEVLPFVRYYTGLDHHWQGDE